MKASDKLLNSETGSSPGSSAVSVCRHSRVNRCPTKPRPVSETVSRGTGLRLIGDDAHTQLMKRLRPRLGARPRPQGAPADSAIKSHHLEGTPSTTVCNMGFARGTRIRSSQGQPQKCPPNTKLWRRAPGPREAAVERSTVPCTHSMARARPSSWRSAGWEFKFAV